MIKALLRGPYLFSALLAAGIVLALVAIGLETDWGRAGHFLPVVKRMAPARIADAGLLPAFSLAPIDQVSPQAGERPLFVPTRRPAPVAVAIQASAMRKGQFLLQGTSITKDFGDAAMLKEVATNRSYVVRKGEQLNGITVDKVEPSRVLLKQGEETEDLAIKSAGADQGCTTRANDIRLHFPANRARAICAAGYACNGCAETSRNRSRTGDKSAGSEPAGAHRRAAAGSRVADATYAGRNPRTAARGAQPANPMSASLLHVRNNKVRMFQ